MTVYPAAALAAPRAALADATRLREVHLTVTDLARSLAFYEHVIALQVHRRDGAGPAPRAGGPAAPAAPGGDDVAGPHEAPPPPPAGRHGGFYHVALLYPSRE